jgi:ketosteroid isomerase-like protein
MLKNKNMSSPEKGRVEAMGPFDLIHTAMKFNEKINRRDAEGLAALMTDDHAFIDSEGKTTIGKVVMEKGWREFFKQFPDYRNEFQSVTVQDGMVVMVGRSVCSFKALHGPNVWTAKVQDGKIAEWRVIWLDKR